jgi:general secretion pathway protein G
MSKLECRPHRRLIPLLGADALAGYTLTEMLVVIAIISLIAAVLTPGLINQMGHARAKTAQLQLDTLVSSVETFRSDVGRYPSEQEGLGALLREPPGLEGWAGPYLRDAKAMQDPWGHNVVYHLVDDGAHFSLVSYGADGKPGGAGLDRDLKAPAHS